MCVVAGPKTVNPTEYYLRAKGKITGPFDVPSLVKLARSGVVRGVDELSSDRAHWSPAAEFRELASVLAPVATIVRPSLIPVPTSPAPTAAASRAAIAPSLAGLARASSLSRRLAPAVGITAGIILLLLLNMPVMVIDNRVLWFWSAVGEPGMRSFVATCLLLLLAGLMLCVVSLTARGLAQPAFPGVYRHGAAPADDPGHQLG